MLQRLGLVAALLLATHTAAHAATPTTAEMEAYISWWESFASLAVADQDSCAKMAADFNKSIDDNRAMLDRGKQYGDQGFTMPDAYKQRAMAAARKLGQALGKKCIQDPAVDAATKRIPHGHAQK